MGIPAVDFSGTSEGNFEDFANCIDLSCGLSSAQRTVGRLESRDPIWSSIVPARSCIAVISLAGYLLATSAAALHTHEHSHGHAAANPASSGAAWVEAHSCPFHNGSGESHSRNQPGPHSHGDSEGPGLVHGGCLLCDFQALEVDSVELVQLQDCSEPAAEFCRAEVPSAATAASHAWRGRAPPAC